jgi:hypothetical protein
LGLKTLQALIGSSAATSARRAKEVREVVNI